MSKKLQTFNPIKLDESGKKAMRVIWSSDSIQMALEGLGQGKRLKANPFYENNTKLLKGDLVWNRTDEEIEEWKKCSQDIIYFCEKYCKLMTPEGIKNISLRDYQIDYLRHLQNNRLSICLASRQIGKTTTSGLFMLWYCCFNVDKNSLVLGNKYKTAVEILNKLKSIFYELPYFLKPGIYKWNETEIVLDNGCRVMAEATTINSGISFTFHCVLADEFAHVAPNIKETFYMNLFPTITAARARFMITSTRNGYDLFYRLYKAAVAKENEYIPFKVDWWQVPEWNPELKKWEKRDETWKLKQIANLGSEDAFNMQYGTDFEVGTTGILDSSIYTRLQDNSIKYINKELPGTMGSENWFFDPSFDIDILKEKYVLVCCDLSEGIGGDYTIFNLFLIEGNQYKNVGFYRTNLVDLNNSAKQLISFIKNNLNQEYKISIELNTYGNLFYRYLIEQDDEVFYNIIKYDKNPGIRITSRNKEEALLYLKKLIETGNLKINSQELLKEFYYFDKEELKAMNGHDDLIMSASQLYFADNSIQIKMLKNEIVVDNQMNFDYYNF